MELVSGRRDVAFVMTEFGYSERQACKLVDMDRSSYRYPARADRNAELREEVVTLARQKPRYGYRAYGQCSVVGGGASTSSGSTGCTGRKVWPFVV
jgi:hypothetical protein